MSFGLCVGFEFRISIFSVAACLRGGWRLSPVGYSLDFRRETRESRRMVLPYRVATLLYCFNARDEVLLLKRAQPPNRGLWSPCGGKLKTGQGESPYACACREAAEELGLQFTPADFHLTGLVSEHGYEGRHHWLMFLFELKPRLTRLPPPHAEGRFAFFRRADLDQLELPATDREKIWPWFWRHRGGFFAAHCHCHPGGRDEWTLEESLPAASRPARRRRVVATRQSLAEEGVGP